MKNHRPYELQEYNPEWKAQFQIWAEKLKPLFGDNLIAIEHIGSTSIKGMMAKPQIDILVIVKDLDLIKSIYDNIKEAGFVPRGREYVGTGDEYVTADSPDGKRLASIHIFQDGHPEIEACRTFRDYLTINEKDRNLYIATKKELYASHYNNYAGYDSGKKEVIDDIKARARDWASSERRFIY